MICVWEGTNAQLMFRGDKLTAEYRTQQKGPTNVFRIQLDSTVLFNIIQLFGIIIKKRASVFNICEGKASS